MTIADFPYKIIASTADADRIRPRGYRGWNGARFADRNRNPSPVLATIPRALWAEAICNLGPANLKDAYPLPAKDQNGLGLCWAYGSTRVVEVKRLALGLPSLELCPESVAGPLTGWRDEGGYAAEAFAQIEQYGIAIQSLCPNPHALNPRLWDPSWQANAKSHEAVNWYDIEQADRLPNYDEVVTCLLNRTPVAAGLDWWGHLVAFLAAIILPPDVNCAVNTPTGHKVGVLFQNSWGTDWPNAGDNGYAVLVEQLATPDGAAAPTIAT